MTSDTDANHTDTGDRDIRCKHCRTPLGIDSDGLGPTTRYAYLTVFGEWDRRQQGFTASGGGTVTHHYCQRCYMKHYRADRAAYYDVDDADRLWTILDSSDGRLVADCKPIFVGGRPFIRVVDGEIECVAPKHHRSESEQLIRSHIERVDVDRDWFNDVFSQDQAKADDERPTRVMLKPINETPFDGGRPDDHDLTEFSADHEQQHQRQRQRSDQQENGSTNAPTESHTETENA